MCCYPSRSCVDWSIPIYGSILFEVLWHGEPEEHGETYDEFHPEAVEVAELEKTQTSRTCEGSDL